MRTNLAKFLKEAGIAYASLIYELKPTTNFYMFMDICETVCSHIGSDVNIAENLIKVKENLELLKEIHRVKGNVELTSLKRAKKINDVGMYLISVKSNDTSRAFCPENDVNKYVVMKLIQDSWPKNWTESSSNATTCTPITAETPVTPMLSETTYDMNQLEQLQNVLMLSRIFYS